MATSAEKAVIMGYKNIVKISNKRIDRIVRR
jgi:hypothetical protein